LLVVSRSGRIAKGDKVKKLLFGALTAWLAFALVSCGGGDSTGGDSRPFSPPLGLLPGSAITGLIGIVIDSSNGSAIANVTVAAGGLSTTTDATGNFAMPTIPNGTNAVTFTLSSYAPQARTVTINPNIETSLIVQMTPNGASCTFDPTTAATLCGGAAVAQVIVGANTLRQADNSAPAAGLATGAVTPIATSLDPYLIPGEYVVTQAAGGNAPFETFGAVDVRITDAAGNALTNLATAATIRIPVSTRAAAQPASVALMRFDTTTGLWVEDGTATLQGVAPGDYYEGSISRIATWTAGQVYTPSTISVCVQDQSGLPISGARVNSDGIDYSGGGTAVTNASGVAPVPMRRNGTAIITATSPRSSNSATISSLQSGADFTLTPCLVMPTRGMTIRLTWGPAPLDLDSHLVGPNSVHVFYASRGSLSSAPFAALDVDDVTSFGPEVITILRLTQGTNEYFVHNFSGSHSPGITGSPARIEVRVGTQTRIFTPPAGEGTNDYWRVFQFTVGTDCSVNIGPVQLWSPTEPVNPAGSATGAVCS
jgi:hypothetical protein